VAASATVAKSQKKYIIANLFTQRWYSTATIANLFTQRWYCTATTQIQLPKGGTAQQQKKKQPALRIFI
jgi:hypothetical protein